MTVWRKRTTAKIGFSPSFRSAVCAISELIAEAKAHKDTPLQRVLEFWRPPAAEALPERRRFQGLIAAKHCSYPAVLPPWITELTVEQREREIDMLRHKLGV